MEDVRPYRIEDEEREDEQREAAQTEDEVPFHIPRD